MQYQYDVIIVGGGPGGCAAAKKLGKAGKKVALVSKELGGECLNYGCIPTKIYLWTADLFEKIAGANAAGIDNCDPRLNWQRMKQRRAEIVAKLKKNLKWTLENAKVEIFEGIGELQDPHTVQIKTSGNAETLTAEHIILATGSEPNFPPVFASNNLPENLKNRVLNNHQILDLPEIPKTLLVIGGGVIGVEFASIFAALGTKVTISERGERLLGPLDADISAEIERVFARKNINILKNASVTPKDAENYDQTLIAMGRKPALNAISMGKLNIRIAERGIATNEYMQTNIPHVFAIGDIAGKRFLAYIAEAEGNIAADFILGNKPQPIQYETVPSTIFSLPEIGTVGLTENQVKEKGVEYVVGKANYSANAKALIMGTRDGFAKIIADKKSGKILGIHIVGEKASELIGEAALAISASLTMKDFSKNLHSHPVLNEILKEACEQLL